MKKISFGDILSVKENAIIVHGCNNHGVMGSGIAKQIRAEYPGVYDTYTDNLAALSRTNKNPMGKVFWHLGNNQLLIANAITQDGFGKDGRKYVSYKAIAECFVEVAIIAEQEKLPVHYPLIGAGLGGGDWAIIADIIESVFESFPTVEHTLWIKE